MTQKPSKPSAKPAAPRPRPESPKPSHPRGSSQPPKSEKKAKPLSRVASAGPLSRRPSSKSRGNALPPPSHGSALSPSSRGASGAESSGKASLSAPPQLSESDLSSSSDTEGLILQKHEAGELSDRIRTSMLQYFGGRKNHTRWVMKCTSRVPEPPPHRTIKKIAIAAYENRSIDFFFTLVAK